MTNKNIKNTIDINLMNHDKRSILSLRPKTVDTVSVQSSQPILHKVIASPPRDCCCIPIFSASRKPTVIAPIEENPEITSTPLDIKDI